MRNNIVSIIAVALIGGAFPAHAAEYFVAPTGSDSNPGTKAEPWATIGKANQTLTAGDTVNLREGEYSEAVRPSNSGKAGSPITYRAYSGESPVISNVPTAIVLDDRNYIVVDGIDVDGRAQWTDATVDHWVSLVRADYNVIRNGDFRYAKGWSGVLLDEGSHHNRILNNRMDYVGTWVTSDGKDSGDMMLVKCANNNLIEGNRFTHGGHSLLVLEGSYNVVRSNTFDNAWGSDKGNRAGAARAAKCGAVPGHNVIEHNTMVNTRKPSDADSATALKVNGNRLIVRRNYVYNNDFEAFLTGSSTTPKASHNRIFHNVMYNNGAAAWRTAQCCGGDELKDNVVLNNIVYRYGGSFAFIIWTGELSDPIFDNRMISNSVVQSSEGDARVKVWGIGDNSLDWWESNYPNNFRANVQEIPEFSVSNPQKPEDFRLAAGSPLIDAGRFLTTAASSGSGTRLTVRDSRYFTDGFGLVPGDLIRVGGSSPVRVVEVDYGNHVLELSRSLSWGGGAGVSLNYSGSAPDIGAIEKDLPPPAPEGLKAAIAQ